MINPKKKHLTLAEVASLFSTTPQAIRDEFSKTGKEAFNGVAAYRKSNGQFAFKATEIQALLNPPAAKVKAEIAKPMPRLTGAEREAAAMCEALEYIAKASVNHFDAKASAQLVLDTLDEQS